MARTIDRGQFFKSLYSFAIPGIASTRAAPTALNLKMFSSQLINKPYYFLSIGACHLADFFIRLLA